VIACGSLSALHPARASPEIKTEEPSLPLAPAVAVALAGVTFAVFIAV
jgi:hypothetical protein